MAILDFDWPVIVQQRLSYLPMDKATQKHLPTPLTFPRDGDQPVVYEYETAELCLCSQWLRYSIEFRSLRMMAPVIFDFCHRIISMVMVIVPITIGLPMERHLIF